MESMSKKYKKQKEKQLEVVKATHIDYVLYNKYEIDDVNSFWLWLFENILKGETLFLSFNQKDIAQYPLEHQQYISFIQEEFSSDIDEAHFLEIENDIFS